MPRKKFPYRAVFDGCIVKATVDSALDKYLSKASLEDLKKLDIGASVDLESNIDLVGTVFNAAVINRMNRNNEGMTTSTALAIKDLFVHKPHNLEHKSSRIVGHIVKTGWSSFGGNKMLTDEEVAGMTEPFNLVLGGVVYRLVDEKFADLLVEASDETSGKYMTIATSWEIAFTKYHLCVGSRNVEEAEIISDPEKIEELKQYLRQEGGPGVLPDGRFIGRLIVGDAGDVLPIGMAFTTRPAAEVEGVLTSSFVDLLSDEEKAELVESSVASVENIENNNSQTIETVVKNNSQAESITMKIKDIKELIAAAASKEGLSEASVQEFITSQLEQKAAEFEVAAKEKDNALKSATDKVAELESEVSKANETVAQLTERLNKVEQETAARQAEQDFQTRMTAIASEFELSEKETSLVAKEIRLLDETSYAAWYEKFSVFAESKSKKSIAAAKEAQEAAIKEAQEAVKLQISKASVSETATVETTSAVEKDAVIAAVEKTVETPNQSVANTTTVDTGKTLKDEWKDAFGGTNMTVTL